MLNVKVSSLKDHLFHWKLLYKYENTFHVSFFFFSSIYCEIKACTFSIPWAVKPLCVRGNGYLWLTAIIICIKTVYAGV